jgi:hypothetical protein
MQWNFLKSEWVWVPIFTVVVGMLLFGGVKGWIGNPSAEELNTLIWRKNGPFELSNESGRFALTYSIVEDQSLQFSIPLARFVVPDLGLGPNGEYVSLFAPGVSFLAIPGYIIGKYFGASQVGAFATSTFFALLNVLLIYALVKKFGGSVFTGLIAGITFAFASPAFVYAGTLYQHHISTFILLVSLWLLANWKGFLSLAGVWFLCALSIVVDNPNLFLMFPVGIFALTRIISVQKLTDKKTYQIDFRILFLASFFTMILPIAFFLWFNYTSHGEALKLSGTLPGVAAIDEKGLPTDSQIAKSLDAKDVIATEDKNAVAFFATRNLLNGFWIHILSPDRGILWFAPVMFFGIFGLGILYKNNPNWGALLAAVILANVLLYSMWGDPWGGWAFGSRYMIPVYAILSIGIGVLLHKWIHRKLFLLVFMILFAWSVGINTLGAITSSENPPKIAVLAIEEFTKREEKYTFMRNWQFLEEKGSKSFVYNTYLKDYISVWDYYFGIVAVIVVMGEFLLLLDTTRDTKVKEV